MALKALRYLGIALAALALVLGGVAAYVVLTFDAARIKQEAAQAVLEKTGRILTIDGDLALSLWPSLGVRVERAALSERNGKERFAAFDSARVAVRLLPLFSKQVVAERIDLDGLKLVLIRDRDGHLNIDDLLSGKQDKSGATKAPRFDVAGIKVVNARIEWRDLRSGRTLNVSDLDFATGPVVSKPDELRVEALQLATRGKLDGDSFELSLDVPGFAREGEQIAAAKIKLKAGLKGATRNVVASLEVSQVEGPPQALRIGGIALDLDARLGDKSLKGNLKSPLLLDAEAGSALLSDLAGTLALDMPGLPTHPLQLPLKGRIKAEYGKPALSGNLATRFDETHADLRFNVIGASPPSIGVELDIDKLDVDRYLPPAKEDKTDDRIDLSALKSLNASGNLRVGELQVKKLKARNLRLTLKAANGRVDIAPHGADAYGGRLSGALSIDAASNRIALKESLSGIDIQPLLKDLADKDPIAGRGDITLDIASRGDTIAALKKGLSGSARAVLRDGAIKGINIAQSLRVAKARLGGAGEGDAVRQASATDKTDFSELSASFDIADGIARNDDLAAKSPFLRLGGNGDIDIGNGRIDYLLKAAIVGTAAGQGGKELDAMKGITVPLRVSGPFEKLSFKLELGNLVNDAAKARIEEKQQEVKRKLQDNLKGQLKGLFEK